MTIKINENLNFNAVHSRNIAQRKIIFEAYRAQLEDALGLKNIPVFLDANVLLYAYKISTQSKEKLLAFYEKNKANTFCTQQVQDEFLNNREKVLSKDFLSTLKQLPRNFSKELINPISKFLNDHKDLLHDYTFLEDGLNDIQKKVEVLHQELRGKVEQILTDNQSIKFQDKVLDVYAEMATTPPLDKEEITFVQQEFDALKDSKVIFPGQKDIKQKSENPYGDYIIFHEMMKFAKIQQKNVVFLTLDFKADWFDNEDEKKKPYVHYIEKFYLNTGQVLYILDAQRALSKVLNDPLKDITDLLEEEESSLDMEAFLQFIKDNPYINTKMNLLEESGYFEIDCFASPADDYHILLKICDHLNLSTLNDVLIYYIKKSGSMDLFFAHLEEYSKENSSNWIDSKVFFFSLAMAASANLVDWLGLNDKSLRNDIEKARKATFS